MADGNGAPPEQERAAVNQKERSDRTAPLGQPPEPDAEQAAALQARRLLEAASGYVRAALRVPDDVDNLQALIAELLFEGAMLRLDVRRLEGRVNALEKRR